MTAPDIRAAFREAWDQRPWVAEFDGDGDATGVVDSLFDIEDFRESELRALDAGLSDARAAVRADHDALVARYRDLLEAAVVRFVEGYHDAPRAKPANVVDILKGRGA